MQPSLYLEVQRATWSGGDAASSYAAVLTTATVVAMVTPLPFGLWAERRGNREIYVSVTLAATIAAVILAIAPSVPLFGLGLATFAGAWGTLTAPVSLRGVRAAFFARRVAPSDLSRAGQLASAAGLVGSVAGPLLAALSHNAFVPAAIMAAAAHAFAAVALYAYLPPPSPSQASEHSDSAKGATADAAQHHLGKHAVCERCAAALTQAEVRYATKLCNRCWDTWFKSFKRRALLAFCAVALLLELSMNAAVVAPFQVIAVEHFGWGSDQIATVNLLSATVSVFVSIAVAHLRLNEWAQVLAASALYVAATLLFAWPPMQETRMVLGLVLGLKAQILFMAPFTAAFSRLIGGPRVTNSVTTILCLAPLIGAALGTALAPVLISHAGTPLFLVTAFPAALAMLLLIAGWRIVAVKEHQEQAAKAHPGALPAAMTHRAPHTRRPWFWKRLEGDHVGRSQPTSPFGTPPGGSPTAKDVDKVPEFQLASTESTVHVTRK